MLKEQMEIWFQNYQIILYNRWFYKDFDIVMAKKHDKIELKTAHLQSSVFKLSKDLIDSIHEEGIVAYTS